MRPTTRRWLFMLSAILIIGLAASRVAPLNAKRTECRLNAAPLPESAKPSMMLRPLLALGRAPLVDFLWLRATKLKDEGRYFDADQLSRLICDLQPRFASVWAFQAWNMAYNISVTLGAAEDRWRWVSNGIDLLRDKGIPLNPNNLQLYRELGWIFFHKVADFTDEHHWYYKWQLARQVEEILGSPPPDYVGPGRSRGEFYRNYDYKPLAEAPNKFESLLQNPETAAFVKRFERFGFKVEESGVYLGIVEQITDETIRIPNGTPETEAELRHELVKMMTDPATAPIRAELEYFWRANWLRRDLKIDPAWLLELSESYGVIFDLRLGETHALYWTSKGLELGHKKSTRIDIHQLNTTRIGYFCLKNMSERGRLTLVPEVEQGMRPFLIPDLRFGEVLFDHYLAETKRIWEDTKGKVEVNINVFGGFVGFTRTLILRYAERNEMKKAREKFEFLRENFPDPMYDGGFERFLVLQFPEDRTFDDYRGTMNRLNGLIGRGLVPLAYDEDDLATPWLNRARGVYDRYHENLVAEREGLPKFEVILEGRVHEEGGRMNRSAYERMCRKLGIEPLPPKDESKANRPDVAASPATR
ncbi:MAG: hypothetical protein O7B26_11140 [Planctomycetota bacterium]|nr:hypothetical protein [Planctomycetota bacterium]